MYDIDYKNIRKAGKFGIPFVLIGLLFLLLGLYMTFNGLIIKSKLDGTIKATSIDENWHRDSDGNSLSSPIFNYEVDGKKYECHTSYSSSAKVDYSKTNVYYDTNNPSKCITDYESTINIFFIFIILIALLSTYAGFREIIKSFKRVKQVKKLCKVGTLIKKLTYTLEDTGYKVNGKSIKAPTVKYTLPNGIEITLTGDSRHDGKQVDEDGLVDLLIDLNNPNNYYIDFEINKI